MKKKNSDNITKQEMPLTGHLKELRRCLIISLVTLSIASTVGFYFAPLVFGYLQAPFTVLLPTDQTFVALAPTEAWIVYLKIGITVGILVSSPVWLYEMWSFIAPALLKRQKHLLIIWGIISSAFLIGGVAIGYYFILPIGLKYFVSILADSNILLLPRMSLYLGFVLRFLLAFGVVGMVPIFIFFLLHSGIVSRRALTRKRPYVIIGSFLLAAIMTPPDVITQIIIALPLIIIFEVMLLLSRIFPSSKKMGVGKESNIVL